MVFSFFASVCYKPVSTRQRFEVISILLRTFYEEMTLWLGPFTADRVVIAGSGCNECPGMGLA